MQLIFHSDLIILNSHGKHIVVWFTDSLRRGANIVLSFDFRVI